MGTRSGDLDPAVPLHIMATQGMSPADMDALLNKKSGLLGVAGHNDLRTIIANKARRQPAARWCLRARAPLTAHAAPAVAPPPPCAGGW